MFLKGSELQTDLTGLGLLDAPPHLNLSCLRHSPFEKYFFHPLLPRPAYQSYISSAFPQTTYENEGGFLTRSRARLKIYGNPN